jgi:hypothetical protein
MRKTLCQDELRVSLGAACFPQKLPAASVHGHGRERSPGSGFRPSKAPPKIRDGQKVPDRRVDSSRDPTQPAAHTNPKRQRGSFPFCRKDLRQSSLTLRVSMNRSRKCQGRAAVKRPVWDDPQVSSQGRRAYQPDAPARVFPILPQGFAATLAGASG